MPDEPPRTDQRAHHRVPCTGDGDLVVRLWRISADDNVPKVPRLESTGLAIPVDLSAGGAGLLITPSEQRRLRVDKGVFVGLLIERKEARVVLHGEIRRVMSRADGLMRLGVTVQLPEVSMERKRGLVQLETLVATIRRIELETLARFSGGTRQL